MTTMLDETAHVEKRGLDKCFNSCQLMMCILKCERDVNVIQLILGNNYKQTHNKEPAYKVLIQFTMPILSSQCFKECSFMFTEYLCIPLYCIEIIQIHKVLKLHLC